MTHETFLTPSRSLEQSGRAWVPGSLGLWINGFNFTPPLVTIDNDETKKLKQFCSGSVPVFVPLYLYKALKLTFPWDVGGLEIDGHIKTEMGQGVNG